MTADLQSMLGDCVSVPDVADALNVAPWFVYELVQADKIPAVKAGRNWLIRRVDAVRFCEDRAIELRTKAHQYDMAVGRLAA